MSDRARDILAADLREAGAPSDMVIRAVGGYYDDFDSPLATPIMQLVEDALKAGLHGIAYMARHGKYDGTREEAEAWAAGAGRPLLDELGRKPNA